MRNIVYWPTKNRLVYLEEKANPEFWDKRWQSEGAPVKSGPKSFEVVVTRRYLPIGARILEGGCGRANKVKALADAGYIATGVDFAANTVNQAKREYPELDIQLGDVRKLKFQDKTLDGYWSLGVIEHFWTGYDDIMAEAARVIKPGGYLFLSTPWFSPYRRWKAKKELYPHVDFSSEPDSFYQFAFSREEIKHSLENHGFVLRKWHGRSSNTFMKEEVTILEKKIEWLFNVRGSMIKRIFRRYIINLLNPFCGHLYIAIAQRIHE